MDLLAAHEVPLFNYSGDELAQDLDDLRAFEDEGAARSSPQRP